MEFPFDLIRELNFTNRRAPLSPDMRPLHKISQILLVLHKASYQNSASLIKLQMFNWAFRSMEGILALKAVKNKEFHSLVRFDPSLNRALNLALAQSVTVFSNSGKFTATPTGLVLAKTILNDNQLMAHEKSVISEIGRISDGDVKTLFGKRYSTWQS